jgi:hypothetical protein
MILNVDRDEVVAQGYEGFTPACEVLRFDPESKRDERAFRKL